MCRYIIFFQTITIIVFTDRILWHSLVKKTTPQEIMNSTIGKSIQIFMTFDQNLQIYSNMYNNMKGKRKKIDFKHR